MTVPLQLMPPPDQFLGLAVTQRQMVVMSALARGDSNREIALQQGISAETVKKHVSLLMEMFQVRNRVQLAVLVALEMPELLRLEK